MFTGIESACFFSTLLIFTGWMAGAPCSTSDLFFIKAFVDVNEAGTAELKAE